MLSKQSVEYTDEGSDEEHCSLCKYFIKPNSCMLVGGRIAPHGWCKKFEKKS